MAPRGKKRPKFLLFPSDLGKNAYQVRKNKLALSGRVDTYNMYETLNSIKSFQEIMQMSKEEGLKYIQGIRAHHKTTDLRKYWKVTSYDIYSKMFKKFDVPVEPKGRKGIVVEESNGASERIQNVIEASINRNKEFKLLEVNTPTSKFVIHLNGQFTGKETSDRIVNILSILGESNNYGMKLKVTDATMESKLKSNTEFEGIATGKEIQDQLQNLNLLHGNTYDIAFSLEEK